MSSNFKKKSMLERENGIISILMRSPKEVKIN